MTILLDTSVLIEIERENKEVIGKLESFKKLHPSLPTISFIVYFEVLEGIIKRNPKRKEKEIEILNSFTCLSASKRTAQILTDLRVKYAERGIQLSLADLIVASTAKEYDLLLITKDNHFKHIEEINKIIL